ncbi:MAG TPA: hypothetical protein VGA60_10765 [Kiloniellales bacterium]|jgi:hypothetical protein
MASIFKRRALSLVAILFVAVGANALAGCGNVPHEFVNEQDRDGGD